MFCRIWSGAGMGKEDFPQAFKEPVEGISNSFCQGAQTARNF